MSSYRKNTLVIDFSILPKRPPLEQVEDFLKTFIKLDMADVKNVQLHNLKNCVFVEMSDAGVATRLYKQHHLQHCFTLQGATYYIPVYVDGPTTTVRILDLPPQMSNSVISRHMEQYGKVISIQNEIWKNYFAGVPNGVRVLRMRMEKPLPSCITIENHTTLINFPSDRSVRGDKQQQTSSSSSNDQIKTPGIQHKQCDAADPPSNHTDESNTSDSETDGNHDAITDNDNNDQTNESAIELESGKRRLSAETDGSCEARENESKRTCSEGYKKSDSEWKVHNTRSRRKNAK